MDETERVPFDPNEALAYIAELYAEKDEPKAAEFVKKTSTDTFGPIIEDDLARMIRVLLTALKPQKVLEIGMSIGFSTTILAKTVQQWGGKVTTIEMDADIVKYAKENFDREGVLDSIEIVLGDGNELIQRIESESFDVVFQDSSKRLYPVMLNDCLRVLRKGGLLLVDDTLFPVIREKGNWRESDQAIDEFNRAIVMKQVESTVLPIGEGFTVAVKL